MPKKDTLFPDGFVLNGRYKMGKALGEGGMGLVQKASDLNLDVPVAIKFLKPGGRGAVTALFHREARHAAKFVGNPHIVQVRDVGTAKHEKHGELAYIVYEFCEKRDLSKLVGSGELELCVRAALDASIGLQYMHENGCTHRDIKPSNLFWGRDSLVKVGDFGLSKLITRRTSTFTGKRLGTPAFMAPEQLRTGKRDDRRVDIYQLGATLYYMLADDIPGVSRTQRPPPLHEDNEDITETLSTLIAEMIEFSPQARPADMSEVCARLREELPRGDFCPLNPNLLQNMQPLRRIRQSLVEKITRVVDSLTTAPAAPLNFEEPEWYATVLLRPSIGQGEDVIPADEFYPVYFACYREDHDEDHLVASSDWQRNPELIERPFSIRNCCSGIPIRWFTEVLDWETKKWNSEDFVHFEVSEDELFLRYVILREVKEGRSSDEVGATLIRTTYATDRAREDGERGIGWHLRDAEGNPHDMSQNIQTEVLIPIYNPSRKGQRMRSIDILGVANFEWDEPLHKKPPRLNEICDVLSKRIQEQCEFPISLFSCDVLQHVTREGDMAKALEEDGACCEHREGCRILPKRKKKTDTKKAATSRSQPKRSGKTGKKSMKSTQRSKKRKQAATKTVKRESSAKKPKKTRKKTRKPDPRSKKPKKSGTKTAKRKSRSKKSGTTPSKTPKSLPKAKKSPQGSVAKSIKKIKAKGRRPGK